MADTVDAAFAEIDRRLKENPKSATGINATWQFNVTGAGGAEKWMRIYDGATELGDGRYENPDTTITIAAPNFLQLVEGRLGITMAFLTGRLKVQGNMGKEGGTGLQAKLKRVLRG